jgi:tetratricopeptide (TPR) repeat protein
VAQLVHASASASLAEEALALAAVDPAAGAALARQALATSSTVDPLTISVAQQALGVASRAAGDLTAALDHATRSVRAARRVGAKDREAQAAVSLAAVLMLLGRSRRAQRLLEGAAAVLKGKERAAAEVQLAGVLYRLGRRDDALAACGRALSVLARDPDPVWEARAWSGRGLLEIERGRTADADRALVRAEEIFERIGAATHSADTTLNRGWCAANAGRPVDALDFYDRAEQQFRRLKRPTTYVELDRARLLLALGLATEALATARRGVDAMMARTERTGVADGLVICAEAAIACGDYDLADELAQRARRHFAQQQRPGWVALADLAVVRAAWRRDDAAPRLLTAARSTARTLHERGLTAPALDARLIAGRTAIALHRTADARKDLAVVTASRGRGSPDQRAKGWYAEALLRQLAGDATGAVRAVRAGVRILDEHRASLGATELRAAAAGQAADLATLGQRLALGSGRPQRVLEWTERWRANALRMPPVRPPDDDELARELAELRRVSTDLEQATAAGDPTAVLQRRRTALEEAVRRRTRRVGGVAAERDRPPTVRALTDALAGALLLEIAELDGDLYGVAVADGRAHLVELGRHAAVVDQVESARSSLRRLAYQRGSAASLSAARLAADDAGRCLDELLIDPIRRRLADRPLVVVPPASLHALPWGVVPSCRSRAVAVAPSAAIWLRASSAPRPAKRRVALVAGPDLPGGAAEVQSLAALHRRAVVLAPNVATAEATSAALDGASLAHVAAHGSFRSDNPLFSSLRMADGPLTIYDLERLRRAPHRIVLSACDSGVAGVRAGDELMGLAAALFPLGTTGLVASVVPVPDEATQPLMCRLHARLVAGDSLAAALTAARYPDDDADAGGAAFAAGAAFVSLGAL